MELSGAGQGKAPATYRLNVEALDLGAEVKAVGLELVEMADGEPVRGLEAASIWATTLTALAVPEPWALDFYSHLERVGPYCREHGIEFREAAARSMVVPAPEELRLSALLARFEGETFGARAGTLIVEGDPEVEGELSRHGVDAYHHAFEKYHFCAVCDFENGFLTLLTAKLWASEIVRRIRPALAAFAVEISRPQ